MNWVHEHIKKDAENRKVIPLTQNTANVYLKLLAQNMHKRALFEGRGNLISLAQALDYWEKLTLN
jgi:hypothetical protein